MANQAQMPRWRQRLKDFENQKSKLKNSMSMDSSSRTLKIDKKDIRKIDKYNNFNNFPFREEVKKDKKAPWEDLRRMEELKRKAKEKHSV